MNPVPLPNLLPHFRVEVDRATGDWLTTPEYLGCDVDSVAHVNRQDTDTECYDIARQGDGCLPETFKFIAVTIVWKDPPVATNVPQFTAPEPEPDAPPSAYEVPQRYKAELLAYVERSQPPGHFIMAVLTNDLKRACREGDPGAIANMPAFIAWLNKHAPARAWGSPDVVAAWIASYDDGIPF